MARTALTAVAGSRTAGVSIGSGATPDATNGNILAAPGPYKTVILVKNADSSPHNVIVRASGYAGAATGAANASYAAGQYQPFAEASQGDLTVTVTNGTTVLLPSLDTDRFKQADGSLWLDWSASTSMTVYVVQRPYLP